MRSSTTGSRPRSWIGDSSGRTRDSIARRERAEQEAEVQRTQARRFKRRARIMFALAVGLLVLLVAVAALLGYARHQTDTASRERHQATYFGLASSANSQLATRPDVSLLLYLAAYSQSPARPNVLTQRSIAATLAAYKSSGAFAVLHGHTDAIEGIAFSPSGSTLASASGDRTVRLWRVGAGGDYPLGAPLRANGPLYSAAFDPTGQILASGSVNRIILWSIRRHVEQRVIPDHSGAITDVTYSPVGPWLAAGGSNGTVLLQNTSTGRSHTLKVPTPGLVRSVAFSPDGRLLAASSDKSVVLFDVATDHRLGRPLTTGSSVVYALAFSRDGHTLAAGGSEGQIVFFDPATRTQSRPPLSGMHIVNSLAFSADGKTLVAGGASATVLWNLAQPGSQPERLLGHHGGVYTVAFNPQGTVLASAGADRTITLWKYPPGELGRPLAYLPKGASEVAVSPAGSLIAAGGPSGQISLISGRTGNVRRVLRLQAGPVGQVAFDPSGRTLAAGYGNGTIVLWDVATGDRVGTLRGNAGSVESLAFDPMGGRLVSGGGDGTVRLWNLRTHAEVDRPLRGGLGAVYAVAFSPDGRAIAAGGDGRAIRLWNAQTERPLGTPAIAQENAVFGLQFSPKGRELASGGADDTIHLWRIGPHSYTPGGHADRKHRLRAQRRVQPRREDARLRVAPTTPCDYGMSPPGQSWAGRSMATSQSVESVAFSRDGRLLVSGSKDSTVRVWDRGDGSTVVCATSPGRLQLPRRGTQPRGVVAVRARHPIPADLPAHDTELALTPTALLGEPASQRPHGVERRTQVVLRVGRQRIGALEDAL